MKRSVMICGLSIATGLAWPLPADCVELEGHVFFEKKDSEVVVCRVTLFLDSQQSIDWRTRDVKLMKRLILDPLANAKPNPRPARYEILGAMAVTRKDGSEEVFTLFHPWGRIKRGDSYLIANLDELPKALEKSLKHGLRFLE